LNHGFEYKKHLGSEASGLEVIDYLARIDAGRVHLEGIPVGEHQRLKPGQLLSWIRPPWEEPDVPRSFALLYKDEHLLAVAKPSGIPTIPGGGCFLENTLLSLVRRHFPGASPLHRLGRGTSGIVLFALDRKASAGIIQSWHTGEILKLYRALASGCPARDDFSIDIPIGPVPHRIPTTIHAANPDGKPAHSRVQVLERRGSTSLLQVTITTGRPHQIRIHLAAEGYPLFGDPLYGMGGTPAKDNRARPSDLGYHLHHTLLGFHHPADGKWIEIYCGPPPLLRLRSL
jgi:23S rRNA pseudouridine1911/1915/1917 synthase